MYSKIRAGPYGHAPGRGAGRPARPPTGHRTTALPSCGARRTAGTPRARPLALSDEPHPESAHPQQRVRRLGALAWGHERPGHLAALGDPRLSDLLAGKLARHPAGAEDEHAITEPAELLVVAAGTHDRNALAGQRPSAAAMRRRAPTSTPRVGSSSRSSRGPAPIHLASSACCWLPPLSAPSSTSGSGGRTPWRVKSAPASRRSAAARGDAGGRSVRARGASRSPPPRANAHRRRGDGRRATGRCRRQRPVGRHFPEVVHTAEHSAARRRMAPLRRAGTAPPQSQSRQARSALRSRARGRRTTHRARSLPTGRRRWRPRDPTAHGRRSGELASAPPTISSTRPSTSAPAASTVPALRPSRSTVTRSAIASAA